MCKCNQIKSYSIGFIISILTILISAVFVDKHLLSNVGLYALVSVIVVIQVIVQILCFLNVNAKTEDNSWKTISLVFSLLIIVIIVTGTLWIMSNLGHNMHIM